MAAPVITLTTDFGLRDPFVGIMKGVIASRAPGVRVIDVSHGVPPQDVLAGALALKAAVPYFPDGTVHLAVVDPGVGSARRAICVVTERGILVGPDNGLLSLATPPAATAFAITDERHFLSPRSRTFHGRDVFAPVAAALATGTQPNALGPAVHDLVRLEVPAPAISDGEVTGQVIYIDHFGNLVTNIPSNAVSPGAQLHHGVTVSAPLVESYAAVADGAPLAVVNSWDLVELAIRDDSARVRLDANVGDPVRLIRN